MVLLPQTWIVLFVFICSIFFNISLLITNQKFRKNKVRNSTIDTVFYIINLLVMAAILAYGTQCSAIGPGAMPSCETFSWVLTIMTVVVFIFNVLIKTYFYLVKP